MLPPSPRNATTLALVLLRAPARPKPRPKPITMATTLVPGRLPTTPRCSASARHTFAAPVGLAVPSRPQVRRSRRRRRFGVDHAFVVAGLHRFGESLAGGAFSLLLVRNMLATASAAWALEAAAFQTRLAQMFPRTRRRRGRRKTSQWYGGGKTIVSSVYGRDPFLLTQWARDRMSRMRLFGHRRFLRLLATFLRPYVSLGGGPGHILGFNLVVVGKISVTGNAMSRTMQVRYGKAGINNLSYHALSSFALIRTKTGCLGFNLSFYYL